MRVYLETSKRSLDLGGQPLGHGGQGEVYGAPNDQRLAVKIWNQQHRTPESVERVRALCRWFSRDPRLGLPIELALDGPGGNVIGFAMPRFPGVVLFAVSNPLAGNLKGIAPTPLDRLGVAALVADCFHAIHRADLCVPDGNEANFLAEQNSSGWQVYAIDCDSYEFEARDSTGQLTRFETTVGKEEYLAPELQAKNSHAAHSEATDRFTLAVLIWHLLKGGAHPFTVSAPGSAKVPPLGELIRGGCWPYRPVQPLPAGWRLVDAGIPWAAFPQEVRDLCERAFHDGHGDPWKRPDAARWRDALSAWEQSERGHGPAAERILRALKALAVVRATAWLVGRMRKLPSLFGRGGPRQAKTPVKPAVRVALVILLVLALGYWAATNGRGRKNAPGTPPPIPPEWGRKPRPAPDEDDLLRGTPKLWRDFDAENKKERK